MSLNFRIYHSIIMLMRLGIVSTLALMAGIAHGATGCSTPEQRQFDFWVGDWDAFDMGASTPDARTHVDLILDGCVLREDYQDTHGLKGQSFTIYDTERKIWHQSWVTNRGQLLLLEGKMQNGEITLSGVDQSPAQRKLVRGTWKPVNGGVRETAVTSIDDGKTWTTWFDIIFKTHK